MKIFFSIKKHKQDKFLLEKMGGGFILPSVVFNSSTIFDKLNELNKKIKKEIGADVITIRSFDSNGKRLIIFLEVNTNSYSSKYCWKNIHEIMKFNFDGKNILLETLKQKKEFWHHWENFDWYFKIRNWCEKEFGRSSLKFIQIRGAWPISSIFCIHNKNEKFYLKSVNKIDLNEMEVLKILKRTMWEKYIPEIFKSNKSLHSFIMYDYKGIELSKNKNMRNIINSIEIFSNLQFLSTKNIKLFSGIPKLNLKKVSLTVENFISLFNSEISNYIPPRMFSNYLERIIESFMQFPFPFTVTHCDFNINNISLSSKKVPTFYDWAGTNISFPFFSILNFIDTDCFSKKERDIIVNTYFQFWISNISHKYILEILELSYPYFYLLKLLRNFAIGKNIRVKIPIFPEGLFVKLLVLAKRNKL